MASYSFGASIRSAYKGLRVVFAEERNFRIQCVAGLGALAFSATFQITRSELLVIIISIFLVLSSELMNSALERFLDIVKPRMSPYVEAIKDIMAGLVLLYSFCSLLIAAIIFLPRILGLILGIVNF